MVFFKKWKERKKEKKQNTKEIRRPGSSYDLYNQSETLTISTSVDSNEIMKQYGYNEQFLKNTEENEEDYNSNITNITNKEKSGEEKMKKTSTKSSSNTNKKGRNIYYVSVRKDKAGKKVGWEVKKENADKVTKICETKEEAVNYVKEKAGNQGSTCIIRKVDGSIDKTLKFDIK